LLNRYSGQDMQTQRLQTELQRLYRRVSVLWWQRRLAFYQATRHRAEPSASMRGYLNRCIQDMVLHREPVSDPIAVAVEITQTQIPTAHSSQPRATDLTPEEPALAHYFRQRSRSTLAATDIVARLQSGIWEHVRAALRYARQAQPESARLHAGIADCGCKELAQFMGQQEYEQFVRRITQYSDEVLKKEQETGVPLSSRASKA